MPLACFAPLAEVPGVRLISLQKRSGAEQVREAARRFPVTEFGEGMDGGAGALVDTAAIMKHLDPAISVDTVVAHLAGALRVPVWVTLSAVADWRWLAVRTDSPWYPTLRLFRQRQLGGLAAGLRAGGPRAEAGSPGAAHEGGVDPVWSGG